MAEQNRRSRRDPEKQKKWKKLVRDQARSGKSIREFCLEQGVLEGNFYSWRRRLRLQDREEAAEKVSKMAAVEIEKTDLRQEAQIEIELGAGRHVRVHAGFDEETLRRVVNVLESEGC